MGTADPVEARRLVRRLAARWDELLMLMTPKIERGHLTIDEQQARSGPHQLLAEDSPTSLRSAFGNSAPNPLDAARADPAESSPAQKDEGNLFFAKTTTVRFSEQLDELHDMMFEANGSQPDNNKTRHMLEAFAWLTGDKVMSDYGPADIDEYVRFLARLLVSMPTTIRSGLFTIVQWLARM
ncbi:hypothetical protein QQW98_04550 [Alteriqipengyuania flavescens]|nr:hypothetical protein [Alteriqipengyuania flavescens]WJY19501.1 hypothetical protein QQW98_04550 [Alteriqipengyuania flavescens]